MRRSEEVMNAYRRTGRIIETPARGIFFEKEVDSVPRDQTGETKFRFLERSRPEPEKLVDRIAVLVRDGEPFKSEIRVMIGNCEIGERVPSERGNSVELTKVFLIGNFKSNNFPDFAVGRGVDKADTGSEAKTESLFKAESQNGVQTNTQRNFWVNFPTIYQSTTQ